MSTKALHRWLWVFFALSLVAYFYLFGSMLIFFILNFFIGFALAIGLPLLMYGFFILAARWLLKHRESQFPEGFTTVNGYVRFWRLRMEIALVILGTLILSGLLPNGWPVSLYWFLLGLATFIFYPAYMKKTLKRSVSDPAVYEEKEKTLMIISSLYSGMAIVVGAAGFVLGLLGLIIGQ